MRRLVVVLPLAIAASAVVPKAQAQAQERDPLQRQTLVDLAYVIGEAHALRQVCKGDRDQFWRDRMMNLLATEDADFAFSERLRGSFNSGFVARQSRHLACTPDTEQAEAKVSAEGQALARKLAQGPALPK